MVEPGFLARQGSAQPNSGVRCEMTQIVFSITADIVLLFDRSQTAPVSYLETGTTLRFEYEQNLSTEKLMTPEIKQGGQKILD